MSRNERREGPPLSRTVDDRIEVRGRDLANELIGSRTFTEMLLLELHGKDAEPAHVRMIDAILVALMEHGLTPSTLAARLVLDGAPESVQGAVAAGLLAAGSRFLGVVEEAALMLTEAASHGQAGARRYIEDVLQEGRRLPGFGHNLHAQTDPRVARLLEIAVEEGVAGAHVQTLRTVSIALHELRPELILNAAGAVAAILTDLGYSPAEARGFAVVARAGGLFAHVVDETAYPIARSVWQAVNESV